MMDNDIITNDKNNEIGTIWNETLIEITLPSTSTSLSSVANSKESTHNNIEFHSSEFQSAHHQRTASISNTILYAFRGNSTSQNKDDDKNANVTTKSHFETLHKPSYESLSFKNTIALQAIIKEQGREVLPSKNERNVLPNEGVMLQNERYRDMQNKREILTNQKRTLVKEQTILPNYAALREQILQDEPPKYEVVTGICLRMKPEENATGRENAQQTALQQPPPPPQTTATTPTITTATTTTTTTRITTPETWEQKIVCFALIFGIVIVTVAFSAIAFKM